LALVARSGLWWIFFTFFGKIFFCSVLPQDHEYHIYKL
jgi:hypothetical protein